MGYSSFEDLDVWKRACRLAVKVYEVLKNCRDFGLKDQITRSAAELRTQIYIAYKVGLLSEDDSNEIVAELKEISSMIQGLIRYYKS